MKVLAYKYHHLILTAGVLFFNLGVSAQQNAYESPAGTKFLLYTPPGYYSTTSTFPLLLSLHSKGEVGYDLEELTSKNPEQMPCRLIYLNRWPQDLPFIVLTPQLKPDPNDPEIQWSAAYIDEVVNYVIKNFRIDLDRFYVTGISRGGTGTWTYASAFPEKIAALLPMSGRSDLTQACPIKNIPVWAFHGDNDDVAPPQYSIDMVNAIKACQPAGAFKPRLNLLHARNHNGWNEIYNGTSGYRVYEWLLMFRKNDPSNKKPYVNAGSDLRLSLRSGPLYIAGDFFDFDGEVTNVSWKQIGGNALTLANTNSEYLKLSGLQTGLFEFELTVTDDKGVQSSDRMKLEITSTSATPSISNLVLLDGKTDIEIANLSEDHVISKTALNLTEINIKAIASTGTASVKFRVNAEQNTRTQNTGPYFIKSQTSYPEWKIASGTYWICATPYPETNARGNPGVSQCYKVTVTDGPDSGSCEGSGTIQQEVWSGISGTLISSIPVDKSPSSVNDLTLFEGPSNIGDNYGRRIRGYICPPLSGDYIFWISSNDNSELWLSADANPGNRKKIAFVSGYTNVRQWDKYTTQRSAAISLVADHKYYIEALQKEGAGTDHVAVGWQLPGGSLERPIPGTRLIPFNGSGTVTTPVVNITSPASGEVFTAPASVTISATASVSGGTITKVEFYNNTLKLGEDLTSPYSFVWSNVPTGSYTVKAKAIDGAGNSAWAAVDIAVQTGNVACNGTGKISREIWTNIQYNDVASIPVRESPDAVSDLTIFEEPANIGDNYGTRVSGYLCVPTTGDYTFWISSNDHSELWLSTDATVANKRRIAWVTGYTNVREWTKYTSQRSMPINLVAGRKYYIEALHKEGLGSDHMAVGWQLPDGVLERPIPGNRLSPFEIQQTSAFIITSTEEQRTSESDAAISVFPNPVRGGHVELAILDNGKDRNAGPQTVEIIRITGEVIHSKKFFPTVMDHAATVVSIQTELRPGFYIVQVTRNHKRFSSRLLVK